MRRWGSVVGLIVGVVALVSAGIGQFGLLGSPSEVDHQIAGRPAQCLGSIALTFDDGPDETFTPQILDVLAAHDVKATFFVLGYQIDGNVAIIERMEEEGHSVQAHTWDHPFLTQTEDDQIRQELRRTSAALEEAGVPAPLYVRPPYGDYDARVIEIVEEEGFQMITWTNALDTRDWDGPASTEQIVDRVRENLQDGGVVLLHDIQPNTAGSVPEIINVVHEAGYCIDPFDADGTWTLDV